MTVFDALAVDLNAAVNDLRGEGFTLSPSHRPDKNAPPEPDLSRSEVEFTATFDDPGNRAGSGQERWQAAAIKRDNPGHTTDRPAINAVRTDFPQRPRQGDLITRAATGERFRIAEVIAYGSLYVLELHR